MKHNLTVSSSPHFHSNVTVTGIMGTVVLALLPVLILSTIAYGWRVAVMAAVAVAASVLSELLFCLVTRRRLSVGDLSCVVTGLLLTFCLPVTTPYLMVFCGALFAILIVKMLFGGIGKNLVNPALAAVAFLYTWSDFPTADVRPFAAVKVPVLYDTLFGWQTDFDLSRIEGTSFLTMLKNGDAWSGTVVDALIGNQAGTVGSVFLLVLLLIGLFLLFRGLLTWHVPVSFLVGVAVTSLLLPYGGQLFSLDHLFLQLCAGGTVLIAFFMATDYTTSPITYGGKLLFGLCCGVLTVAFRFFGCLGDGAVFAVLLMNLFVTVLDRLTRPKRYGRGGVR